MQERSKVLPAPAETRGAGAGVPDSPGPGRSARPSTGVRAPRSWWSEPKAAVWIALAVAVLVGGGRSSWGRGARKAVARLDDPRVTIEEIAAVADHGRAGVWELLRIFSTASSLAHQQAAGGAPARLWKLDQLVAEEEQAVVRRGYTVTWNARRRYPRAMQAAIPIVVEYEVPFLNGGSGRVGHDNLEWSHRIQGARRATLEEFSPWVRGRGRVAFTIFPGDFESKGPHRLVLQTRVHTVGLTDRWEIEPPHVPFAFEFDPLLLPDAIMTLPDAGRDEQMARAIGLRADPAFDTSESIYLPLGGEWTVRNPPRLAVATPLPCDLAHSIAIELEGAAERFDGGRLVVSGQGIPRSRIPAGGHDPKLRAWPDSRRAAGHDRAPGTEEDARLAETRRGLRLGGPRHSFGVAGPNPDRLGRGRNRAEVTGQMAAGCRPRPPLPRGERVPEGRVRGTSRDRKPSTPGVARA